MGTPTETKPRTAHTGPTFGAVILFIAAIVAAIALVTGGTGYAIYTASHQVNSSCGFWKALATAPIAPVPPVKVVSKFGVTIVLKSLEAYNGQGCGHLEPSPDLTRWARYWHLKLP